MDLRNGFDIRRHIRFETGAPGEGDEVMFELDLQPPLSGLQYYKIRIYPYHELLSHRFETGCMIWL